MATDVAGRVDPGGERQQAGRRDVPVRPHLIRCAVSALAISLAPWVLPWMVFMRSAGSAISVASP